MTSTKKPDAHFERLAISRYEEIKALRSRIAELESTIEHHGIPVKTATGGVAHYCTSQYGNTPPTSANGVLDDQLKATMEQDDLNTELTRLSRIEDVAIEVIASEVWSGDEFYDRLCKLRDVLGEE